ncbi:MAG: polysaccharide biosynthesis tyrosine autokinase [Nostocoides sp.]
MTIREFVGVLKARWFVIAICTLAALGGAAALTLMTPNEYSASARVYLAATAEPAEGQTDTSPAVISTADLNTYVQVLSSPDFMDPLRAALDLQPGDWVRVTGESASNTALLELTATANTPQLAAGAANLAGPQLASVALKFSPLLAQSAATVTSTTVRPATVPTQPASPNLQANLLLGAAVGLLAGIGLAFIRQLADTKVRRDEDVAAATTAPILAHLPLEKTSGDRPLITRDRHNALAEGFRRLRTNLLFVDVTTAQHSVVVTSALAGEGKTTVSVNLALAMADTGLKVLLVDGDLRHPSVAKALSLDNSVGLTTVLLGRIEVEQAIQRYPGSDLDVMAAGQVPPNPSELIGSVPMEMLYHDLKSRYDFIVIDSPPLVPVVDAVLLDKIAGNLLLVVAAGKTNAKDVHTAVRQLESASGAVSGVVLNVVTGELAQPYEYGYHRPEVSDQSHPELATRGGQRRRRDDGRRG